MNQITIAGHLGADPEVRFTPSGRKVTTLRVATKSRRSGKDETIWWRVTVWGEEFDKMISYFKKGSSIIVVGDLTKPEVFTGRDGVSQVSMNITAYHISFSPFGRPEGSGQQESSSQHAAPAPEMAYAQSHEGPVQGQGKMNAFSSDIDEEIPF